MQPNVDPTWQEIQVILKVPLFVNSPFMSLDLVVTFVTVKPE